MVRDLGSPMAPVRLKVVIFVKRKSTRVSIFTGLRRLTWYYPMFLLVLNIKGKIYCSGIHFLGITESTRNPSNSSFV